MRWLHFFLSGGGVLDFALRLHPLREIQKKNFLNFASGKKMQSINTAADMHRYAGMVVYCEHADKSFLAIVTNMTFRWNVNGWPWNVGGHRGREEGYEILEICGPARYAAITYVFRRGLRLRLAAKREVLDIKEAFSTGTLVEQWWLNFEAAAEKTLAHWNKMLETTESADNC
jgi:hypothetical protein